MILWGGNEDYTPNVFELLLRVNTGGRYNPNTDTWTPTSTTGAPTARDLHSAVWTGTTMIVWGGLVTESGYVAETRTQAAATTRRPTHGHRRASRARRAGPGQIRASSGPARR